MGQALVKLLCAGITIDPNHEQTERRRWRPKRNGPTWNKDTYERRSHPDTVDTSEQSPGPNSNRRHRRHDKTRRKRKRAKASPPPESADTFRSYLKETGRPFQERRVRFHDSEPRCHESTCIGSVWTGPRNDSTSRLQHIQTSSDRDKFVTHFRTHVTQDRFKEREAQTRPLHSLAHPKEERHGHTEQMDLENKRKALDLWRLYNTERKGG